MIEIQVLKKEKRERRIKRYKMTGSKREKERKKTLKNCFNIKASNIITSFLPLK